MPELWMEVWRRPGHATPGRVIDFLPAPHFGFHDGVNLLGDGSAAVASSFDRFDEILSIDTATPSNSVSSLIRLFASTDPTTPLFEWLPRLILPTTSKADRDVNVSGLGIKQIWGYARVEAFDWDGSADWVATFPDWIYGGANALSNPDFENNTFRPSVFELWNDGAAADTFTVTDGTDTTAAIDWDATANALETRLETDIAAYDDVLVTGAGTEDDPWVIEFVTELTISEINMSIADTGMTSTLTTIQFGAAQPGAWTKSQTVSRGTPIEHGDYTSFFVSTGQAHSGDSSLFINPAIIGRRYAGAQQVVRVTPGGTYQASVWVYPTNAATKFRLIIRGIDEDFIASDTGGTGGTSYPANEWSEVTISDVLIRDGETQVIFRFANVDATGDPAPFYIDDAEFDEGQPVTTIGKILGDLYDDATSDHSAVRLVWEDEANPGNPYLTLDFTDAVDSAGVAWFHSDIEIKLWMRMTYLQVMEQFVTTWGYEWRIVPDSVEDGTWKLQVYNPGGMQTDYTAAASPAIQGGSSDVRRAINRILPAGSDFLVEGLTRLTTRIRESDLESALGLIEVSRLDRELPSQNSVLDAAFEDSVEAVVAGLFFIYTLTNPSVLPLDAYLLGDLLTVHDPPEVNLGCRFVDVQVVASPAVTEYEVQFIPATAEGS